MIIDEDEEFEDDDEFDEEDEFAGMTLDEKKELFLRLYASLDKHTTEDSQQFFNLIDSIVNNLTDTELYDQYYDEIFEELYMDIDEDEVPDELLGLEPGNRSSQRS